MELSRLTKAEPARSQMVAPVDDLLTENTSKRRAFSGVALVVVAVICGFRLRSRRENSVSVSGLSLPPSLSLKQAVRLPGGARSADA